MEQIVEISGEKVSFKKTGATMLKYKRQTGREFYSDLSAFIGLMSNENGETNKLNNHDALKVMSETNFDYMYDMLHVMARSADPTISADVLEWLETFDDFPVVQIFCEIAPMICSEMAVDRKNA